MAIGITEINTDAAARPLGAAFYCNVRFRELRLPRGERVGRNRERDVHRPVAVVRRYSAAGHMHGLQRLAAQEQQQQTAAADVVSAQPLVAINAVEPEHLLVERTGTLEAVDV